MGDDLGEVISRDERYHLGVYGKRFFPDILIVKADGVILTDSTGREYIDCVAGISSVNVGHNNSTIEQRVREYKDRKGADHLSNLFYIGPQAEYAEKLAQVVPIGGTQPSDQAKVFFCNSGAEATNGAIKLAAKNKGYWLVGMSNTFHARYGAALAATGQDKFHKGFEKTLPANVKIINFNNLDDLKNITDDTYAVMMEVIEGEGGIIPADRVYIDALRDRCRQTGALLIADEVQTGFGRTGRMFASQHYDLHPDAICMAKGIANGYPFGAIALGQNFAAMVKQYEHASTFGGNAEGCIRATAVLDIIREQNLLENAQRMEGIFYSTNFKGLRHVNDARGKGLLLGVELDSAEYRTDVINRCKQDGVLFCGCGASTIRIVPPLTITEDQFGHAMEVLQKNIKELKPERKQ